MAPTSSKVGWQSSPKTRGTTDLLFSCATTLFLCAWTAYHPNVPTGRGPWARVGHRLTWMAIAVIAPEVVLWCAWDYDVSEQQKARVLTKKRREPWTLEHTFFALTGGYALPSPIPSQPQVTQTSKGVLLFVRLDLFPPVSSCGISDKSKADGIAKTLVCLQADWFIVQIIARTVAKLPVTTLEIHVLVHVLCTFAICGVWFEKGYDVGEAILVENEEGRDLAAFFEMKGSGVSTSLVKCI
ncbi:hypothetical protein BU23DRAFT_541991 [Bimuria novae-zelandiae CBS 107.79]|uniref:Uncharacterized protein n=1 Tax=Bimuria novae-zelandiae CBS 107.79 TaxID=1447943 RepID=A0A6A5UVH3_9PLEO|nr:hypothetical protein BU23DRAFT_541991 [Bimuria novae-zelandiae CBS 107.79]